LHKKRLLTQLALPSGLMQPYVSTWTRPIDLFGDQFVLTAVVNDEELSYTYHKIRENSLPECIWTISINNSPKLRARIGKSEGIDPPIKSIVRAIDLIMGTIDHTQSNPVITTTPSTRNLKVNTNDKVNC